MYESRQLRCTGASRFLFLKATAFVVLQAAGKLRVRDSVTYIVTYSQVCITQSGHARAETRVLNVRGDRVKRPITWSPHRRPYGDVRKQTCRNIQSRSICDIPKRCGANAFPPCPAPLNLTVFFLSQCTQGPAVHNLIVSTLRRLSPWRLVDRFNCGCISEVWIAETEPH